MKVKVLLVVLLLALGLGTAAAKVSSARSQENEYDRYLTAARRFAEKEVPFTSIQNYKAAFAVRNDDENVYREYMAQSRLLGDSFYKTAVEAYPVFFPTSSRAYEDLCTFYRDNESYAKLLTTAAEAREKGIATDAVREMYLECYYAFRDRSSGFEQADRFVGGRARVKRDGLYGYLHQDGGYALLPVFLEATSMVNGTAAVRDEEEWYMMNSAGFKVARSDRKADSLSFPSGGKIRVELNGHYGYTDTSLVIPEVLPYDEAANYRSGISAVKKDGKWALIDRDENLITDYVFDEVVLDEMETCICSGVIFVRYGDVFYMVDESGSRICEQGFDEVYPFVSSEPAAVRVGDLWGFVDASGNMLLEPQFEEARSFCIGLAPVREGERWGYVNRSGEYRISSQFADAMPFSENGMAAVKEDELWKYIILNAYYYSAN